MLSVASSTVQVKYPDIVVETGDAIARRPDADWKIGKGISFRVSVCFLAVRVLFLPFQQGAR